MKSFFSWEALEKVDKEFRAGKNQTTKIVHAVFFSPDKKRESVIIGFISYNRDKTTNNNEINLPRFFIGNVDSVSGRD